MQRPQSLDYNSRFTISPPPTPLPTPLQSSTQSPFERSTTMSPVATRYSSASSCRKPSRNSYSSATHRTSLVDDGRNFIYEQDASTSKYMHYFDKSRDLEIVAPQAAEHQVKQDPSGTLKTWEYQLPERLWPPVKETAKCQDASLKIRWGRENGYVQITNIGKALLIPNLKMSDFLRGYDDQIVRIRGGQIEVQGSWIPYDLAYKVCSEKCYKIRQYLTPLFGPDFANECIPTEGEEKDHMRRRPGRKPRASPLPGKRKVEDCTDDDNHPAPSLEAVPIKRRSIKPCASGTVNPPIFPPHLNLDNFGRYSAAEICEILATARELERMQYCPFEGVPTNEWPMPGDSRLGGYLKFKGGRYFWNGADQFVDKHHPSKVPTLPSLKDLVPSVPTLPYSRFPITPPPVQSPYNTSSYDWQNSAAGAAAQTLISPPMSLRESFNGRDRGYSIATTDECRTPVQELYSGSLFPTPQPESRFD